MVDLNGILHRAALTLLALSVPMLRVAQPTPVPRLTAEQEKHFKLLGLHVATLFFNEKYEDAIAASNQELNEAEAIGDPLSVAGILADRSFYLLTAGRPKDAVDGLTRSKALCQQAIDRGDRVGWATLVLANISIGQQRYDVAAPLADRALELFSASGTPFQIGSALQAKASCALGKGSAADCLALATQAFDRFRAPDDAASRAICYLTMSTANTTLLRPREALIDDELAIKGFHELDWKLLEITLLNARASSYGALGDLESESTSFNAALQLCQQIGDRQNEARARNGLFVTSLALGKWSDALDQASQAMRIADSSGDPLQHCIALSELASVSFCLGSTDDAVSYSKECEALLREVPPLYQISIETSLAANYIAVGDMKAADAFLESALKAAKDQKTPIVELNILNLECQLYGKRGALDKLRAVVTEAQKLVAGSGAYAGFVASMEYAADMKEGRYAAALQDMDVQLRGTSKEVSPLMNAKLKVSLGICLDLMGRNKEASDTLFDAVSQLESEEQLSPVAYQPGAFEWVGGGAYYYFADSQSKQGKATDALLAADRGRSRTLSRHALFSRRDLAAVLPPDEAAEAKRYRDAVDAAYMAASERRGAQLRGDAKAAQLAQRVERACIDEMLMMEKGLRKYPQFVRTTDVAALSRESLKALLDRNPDTLFLEYSIGDRHSSLLFAASAQAGVRQGFLPVGFSDLFTPCDNWRHQLEPGGHAARAESEIASEQASARKLYGEVIQPLKKLGVDIGRFKRIVVVPDNPLSYVPFAAIMDGNGHRLIDSHTVATAASLVELTWEPNRLAATRSLLCYNSFARDAAKAGGEESESAALSTIVPRSSGIYAKGVDKKGLLEQCSRYAVIHVASHASPATDSGLESWINLDSANGAPPEQWRLYARDILCSRLAAQLVVLASCQSGFGELRGSEGLVSLAWAFRAAGASSVVGSLWHVERSGATRDLMVRFYRRLMRGERKDDALRAAMQEVRAGIRARTHQDDASLWAAFQLEGDAGPLVLPRG